MSPRSGFEFTMNRVAATYRKLQRPPARRMSERELVTSLSDARRKIDTWRQDYDEQRPHSSLYYFPPADFARKAAEMTT